MIIQMPHRFRNSVRPHCKEYSTERFGQLKMQMKCYHNNGNVIEINSQIAS